MLYLLRQPGLFRDRRQDQDQSLIRHRRPGDWRPGRIVSFASAATFVAEVGDETLEQYLVGASYTLAKGVVFNAYGAYVDFEDASGGLTQEDVEGWVLGTAIKISF